MSGSMLGPDQIKKINGTFPALVKHVRELLAADKTGVGLMKVHCMVESFDSDEMARIFRELSFISPLEKKALVRAAIYEVMALDPLAFVSPEQGLDPAKYPSITLQVVDKLPEQKVFTPPQFKLNVATSNAAETAKTDTKPTPVVTSTHTPKIADQIKAGDEARVEQQKKLDAAVAKLRESSQPKVVEVIGVDVADGKETTVVAEVAPTGEVTVISETQTAAQE